MLQTAFFTQESLRCRICEMIVQLNLSKIKGERIDAEKSREYNESRIVKNARNNCFTFKKKRRTTCFS